MATYGATVPVIRHKNRTGKDNPVSGALTVLPVAIGNIGSSETAAFQWTPPAGMNFEIVAIEARCTAHNTTPIPITIGTAAAGAEIVAATNLTTTLGPLTLVSTAVTPSNTLDIRLVAPANATAEDVSVTVVGYTSVPPDIMFLRNTGHF